MSELLVFILIIVALVVILIVFLYQNNSTVKTFVENEQKKTILEISKSIPADSWILRQKK